MSSVLGHLKKMFTRKTHVIATPYPPGAIVPTAPAREVFAYHLLQDSNAVDTRKTFITSSILNKCVSIDIMVVTW